MASNNSQQGLKPSERGEYLIPPLPNSSLRVDKENKVRASSNIGEVSASKRKEAIEPVSRVDHHASYSQEKAHNVDQSSDQRQYGHGSGSGRRGRILAPLGFSDNGLLSSSNSTGNGNSVKGSEVSFLGNQPRKLLSTGNSTRRRVLRYRETMESLFCLTPNSSNLHRQLCRDIVEGQKADDAFTWSRVLQLATEQDERNRIPTNSNTTQAGRDLIRLHRRATSRFPLEKQTRSEQSPQILRIWLSYAKTIAKFGSADDCRLIYRQIQEQGPGFDIADYYLAFAEFEQQYSVEKAKDVLKSGIAQNAQPLQKLRDALESLTEDGPNRASIMKSKPKQATSLPSTQITMEVSSSLSPRKRKADQEVSPKRRRTEEGAVEVTENNFKQTTSEEINMSFGGDELSLTLSDFDEAEETNGGVPSQPKIQNRNERNAISLSERNQSRPSPPRKASEVPVTGVGRGKESLNHLSSAGTSQEKKGSLRFAVPEVQVNKDPSNLLFSGVKQPKQDSKSTLEKSKDTTKDTTAKDGGSAFKRPPLLSKTPRLTRVGLSGKPQRIGTEQSVLDSSDSDDSDDTMDHPKDVKAIFDTDKIMDNQKSATKITKMDLDYMWAWDPDNHPRRASGTGSQHSNSPSQGMKTPAVQKKSDIPSSADLFAGNPQSSQTRKSVQSTDSEQSERSQMTNGSSLGSAGRQRTSVEQVESRASFSPADAQSLMNSNPDFLPLVNENNIIRVNDIPYVKLGVVGKGGSSKVYRALTKDCTVLAIKKIKLKGMQRKEIEGFANEISLLKRLRGNPAIIQMYDSQVDLKQRAIFVVMEAGEVDLNYVLQQQASASAAASDGKTKALNINFIRLTWQQMLSAVHCIHEERIIHGDLKPANFLFVRGGLKLIDFGIAKAIHSDDTTNIYRESQIGTLNYMSPEAIKFTETGQNGAQMKLKLGRASDIWALGCILYQMAYGKTPFASLHMVQKLHAIINSAHQISFPNTVDEAAIDAMQKCLRRTPEERPPIVGENGLLNAHCFLNSNK